MFHSHLSFCDQGVFTMALWEKGPCQGTLCLPIFFPSDILISGPVFGEVLIVPSPFSLIISKAWTRDICPSAVWGQSEQLYLEQAHSLKWPIPSTVSRLGCAHGLTAQGGCFQPPMELHCSNAQMEESFWPYWDCFDHSLLGENNTLLILLAVRSSFWVVNYYLQGFRAPPPLLILCYCCLLAMPNRGILVFRAFSCSGPSL